MSTAGGKGVRVTATPARHGPEDFDRGPVIGFVVQAEDESSGALYVSGDTVWFGGVQDVIDRFPDVQAALLFAGAAQVPIHPANLTWTAAEMVNFARVCPQALIVPVHFEGWQHFSEGRKPLEAVLEESGVAERVRWLEAGKPTQIV